MSVFQNVCVKLNSFILVSYKVITEKLLNVKQLFEETIASGTFLDLFSANSVFLQ